MKRTFLLAITALVALMAASCQKEDLGRVLTATIEQYEHDSNAKVYVNPQLYACWNDGDTVRINGQEVLVSIDDTATLPIPQGMENQDITAYYPASDINSNMSGVTLPYEQLYRTDDQGRQIIHNPMAAYCPAGGTELRFRNLGALLKITLPAQEDGAVVHSITVKGSKDYPLCGTATLEFASDHKPQLSTPLQNGCDSVTLTHIDVALTKDRSFYIVVPAYSLFREITVSVVLERPQEVIRRNSKTDDTFGHLLDRNHIGALTYNLDGTERIIGGKRVIFYTTSDGSILTPQNMENCDNSEYGALVFANNVTAIGNSAFSGCYKLASITLPEGVTTIGNSAFEDCFFLKSITLPSTLTWIGEFAFHKCGSLTSIALPEGVTTIGGFAFSACSKLASISLPQSLTEIGNSAFSLCGKLTRIDCYATTPPNLGDNVFAGIPSTAELHVPSGQAETYSGSNWGAVFSGEGRIKGDL